MAMNAKIISTERENITENTKLTTVKSFDELFVCHRTTYNDGVLTIEYTLVDFEIDSVCFTEIKERHSELKQLCFNFCTFPLNIVARDAIIECSLHFQNTTFAGGVNFDNCNFNGTIEFEKISPSIGTSNNNALSFNNCFFHSDSIVIVQNIDNINYNIVIEKTTIRGIVIMRNIKANSLSLKDSKVTGTISLAGNIDFNKTIGSHTDCILKHEAHKISDIVNFLKYRKREHVKIYKELFKQKKYVRGSAKWLVVTLNRISNDFGQNWILGVGFTVGFAMLFVAILIAISKDLNFSTYWNDSLNFLWLPSTFSEESKKIADVSMTIYLLGKIVVGFGIYQTITAFRRHGK